MMPLPSCTPSARVPGWPRQTLRVPFACVQSTHPNGHYSDSLDEISTFLISASHLAYVPPPIYLINWQRSCSGASPSTIRSDTHFITWMTISLLARHHLWNATVHALPSRPIVGSWLFPSNLRSWLAQLHP